MKINWGTGLAIFMFAFVIFILSFVYKTFTNEKYNHQLVSKEYYKDEINYQQEIDALSNAKKLKTNLKLIATENGIQVVFPSDFEESTVEGIIKLQRTSDIKLDFDLPIELINNELLIPKEKLVKGLYNIKINWVVNNKKYQFKEKYTY